MKSKHNVVPPESFEEWLKMRKAPQIDKAYYLPHSIDLLPCGCKRSYSPIYTGGDV